MKTRYLIGMAALCVATSNAELFAIGVRRDEDAKHPPAAARPAPVNRTPTLPRRATPAPAPNARSQSKSAPRSAARTDAHDLSYPRSVKPAVPQQTKGPPEKSARTWQRPSGGLGMPDSSHPHQQSRNPRSYITLDPNLHRGGHGDWNDRGHDRSRDQHHDRDHTGFAHRLDHHWDLNGRRELARGVQVRVRPYHYFRPDWRPYAHGWGGDVRWRNYWTWSGWRPYYWWRRPAWTNVVTWIPGVTWATYVPYDYGDTIIYQNNVVYQNGQQIATADQYAQQAMTLAQVQVPPPPPPGQGPAEAWQPLGVFALVTDENADPDTFLQLALSREGFISGTYYNQLSGETLPIQGSVDRRTQRAAWRVGDDKGAVMEAGLYNLTQDQAPLLIHFGTTTTENYLLVRMDQPPEGMDPGAMPMPDYSGE